MEQKFAFLDAVIEGLPNMIFIKDARELRFLRLNRAGEQLLGFSREQLLGKSDYDLFSAAEADHFTRLDRQVLETGEALDIPEEVIHTSSGELRYLHTKKIALYDEHGKAAYLVGISEDITDRKRLEEERIDLLAKERAARLDAAHMTHLHDQEQAQRLEAERLNRIKDEFLATLSHELRTPLHAIIGWTSLLLDGAVPAQDIPKALGTIERNARAEAQLVNDLLDVSGIITGHFVMDRGLVDPVATMRAAIDVSRIAASAKDIRVQLHAEAGPLAVLGDANRLQQVFWNLLSNAIKFTPKGGFVEVSVGRAGSDVEIAVRDSGVGIPEEFLPFVFDRFRQADSSVTRRFGGLGLGLSIVRHLVELHGGHVAAASEGEGKGAMLTVTLPFAAVDDGVFDEEERRVRREIGVLHQAKLLVVDDDADTRDLLRSILVREGAHVMAAASAGEARAALHRQDIDAIVSDIGMPEEDGLQFIRWLRQSGNEIPTLALTAYATELDRRQVLDAGFDDYLAKPVKPALLLSRLQQLLERGGVPPGDGETVSQVILS